MFGITDLSTYIIGTIAIILLPGPNSMFCLTAASQFGVKAGYRAAAAIFVGDSLLMLATALGAGSALKAHPTLFLIMKVGGGLYLAYIGAQLLWAAAKKWVQKQPETTVEIRLKSSQHIFTRALTLSLSNPKAILFYLSFFVQFVDVTYPQPLLTFLALGVILQIISMLYLTMLIFAGIGLVHLFRRYHHVAAAATGTVGVAFMGFALKMWAASGV
ncbi:MAG: leucine efflux protein LeuE [Neisseria sp.]|nr:leucine efflux protein LeuE [Neisseria sp.]